MRDHASNPNLKIIGFDYVPCEWGEVMLFLSRDIGENLTVVILPPRSRVLQWSCHSFNLNIYIYIYIHIYIKLKPMKLP